MTTEEKPVTSTTTSPKEGALSREEGGCRGWMVVVGSFAVHVLLVGVTFTYGVLVPSMVSHFDCGRAVVGGVASLMVGLSWISGEKT